MASTNPSVFFTMHHLIHCMVYMAYMYVEYVFYTSVLAAFPLGESRV